MNMDDKNNSKEDIQPSSSENEEKEQTALMLITPTIPVQTSENEEKEQTVAVKAATEKLKEKKKPFLEKAAGLFKLYPQESEFYFTGDGYAFFQKSDAQNHARSLKEKEIITIKNKNDASKS